MERAYAHAPSSTTALIAMLQSIVPRSTYGAEARADPSSLIGVAKRRGLRTSFFASGTPYEDELRYLAALGVDEIKVSQHVACSMNRSRTEVTAHLTIDDRCAQAALLRWIDREKRPFLSVLWNFQTHYPYYANRLNRPFPRPRGMSELFGDGRDRYLNALRETDEGLGQLVEELDRRGLTRDTLIVVMGDHGESFGQHGIGGHGVDIYEESIHIPVVFINPSFAGRQRFQGLFGEVDIAPSVSKVMGFEHPSSWRGVDVFSGRRHRRLFYFATGHNTVVGYREQNVKVMLTMPPPGVSELITGQRGRYNVYSLFDLQADPRERREIILRPPERLIPRRTMALWAAGATD
jgi:arylsulfatase A-like enzyme